MSKKAKTTPRNHIALALAARRSSGAAGRHERSAGAQRSADKAALRRQLARQGWQNWQGD